MKGLNYIRKAIDFATIKHAGQFRKGSGLAYVTHPIKVGFMLQSMNMSYAVIIAGILHDTLENTDTTYEELVREFGVEVADLVLELTSDKKEIRRIQKALDKNLELHELMQNFEPELAELMTKLTKEMQNDVKGLGKNIYLIYKMIYMSKNALCGKLGDRLDNVSDAPPEKYMNATLLMINKIKERRMVISIEAQELMDNILNVIYKKKRKKEMGLE